MENMKENKRSLTIDIKNLIVRWKDSDMTVHKLGERKYLVLKVETIFYDFSQISLADITTIVYTYRNLFGTDNS